MTTVQDPTRRRGAPATMASGFRSYADGHPTEAATLEELATVAAAAIDAGAETHWLRACTPTGERSLTRKELLAVLVAMSRIPLAGD